jgi:hypothetical protein
MSKKTWERIKRLSELLALISVAISLPVGFYHLWEERVHENELLAQKTYDDLDNRYIEYEKLCLQYVRLDCADKPLKNPPSLSVYEVTQQKLLYNIMIAILERAYSMYRDVDQKTRGEYWDGWDKFADDFMIRPTFRAAWKESGNEYHIHFQEYMNAKVDKLESPAQKK